MKSCLYVLLTGCLACASNGRQAREFDGVAAAAYVDTMLAFGPRVPGTAGHRRTGDWILKHLQAMAESVEVQAFEHVSEAGDTLAMRNFIARFRPGEESRVLLLAHWDTRPRSDQSKNIGEQNLPVPGANDGASGTAILLGVADALKKVPPALGVDLLFVDGEDYGDFDADTDVLIGSRYFADNLPDGYQPLFAVLFDMVGDANLEIFQEANSVNAAPEVVERVWSKARDLGYGRVFRSSVGYSLIDDHMPLVEKGIRAIDVIDFDYPYWHTAQDTRDKISVQSLQIVGEVAVALTR